MPSMKNSNGWCTHDFMWNKQMQLRNLISNFRKIFDSSYDEQERGACDLLVNLCRTKKRETTIIYSKIYVRAGFQLIFIFHRCADKYSVTLCS